MPSKLKRPAKKTSSISWEVELLRCTAFAADAVQLDRKLWDHLTGKLEPLEVRSVPQTVYIGSVDGPRLAVQAAGQRIDVVMQPMQGPPNGSSRPTLGSLSDTAMKFQPIIDRLFAKQKILRRLAFGCVLTQGVQSVEEGKDCLLSALHDLHLKQTGDVHDIMLQINRRRKSKIIPTKDFHINRLAKWSMQQVVPAMFQVTGDALSLVSQSAIQQVRLDLDINTAAIWSKPLPANRLTKLFRELWAMADELQQRGDVP